MKPTEWRDDYPEPAAGQVWKDNDIRTKGSGEFKIVSIEAGQGSGKPVANVTREDGRRGKIRVDRFRPPKRVGAKNARGYTYVGMSR